MNHWNLVFIRFQVNLVSSFALEKRLDFSALNPSWWWAIIDGILLLLNMEKRRMKGLNHEKSKQVQKIVDKRTFLYWHRRENRDLSRFLTWNQNRFFRLFFTRKCDFLTIFLPMWMDSFPFIQNRNKFPFPFLFHFNLNKYLKIFNLYSISSTSISPTFQTPEHCHCIHFRYYLAEVQDVLLFALFFLLIHIKIHLIRYTKCNCVDGIQSIISCY